MTIGALALATAAMKTAPDRWRWAVADVPPER